MGGISLRIGVGILLFGAALSCAKSKEAPVARSSLSIEVVGIGTVGEVSACKPDGSACERLAKGTKLDASTLFKAGPGARAELRFDPATTLSLAGETEVALDASTRTIEVRRGIAGLGRVGPGASGPLGLVVRDQRADLDDKTEVSLTVSVYGTDVADLSVGRGRLGLKRGAESVELHAGEMARLTTGHPADLRAAFSARTSIAPFVWGENERAPSAEPRGLGRMTARVPGQDAVVSGVRLATHHVRAVVRDGFARTEVDEEFENETNQVLEGRYVFPVPPGASISRLALWVGDKLVEGEIVEKKRAAAIFKGIVDDTVRPRDPALLEWVSGGEFSLKIFPLPAKGRRRVLVAYDQALPAEGERGRYVYPLSLGADRATKIDDFSIGVTVSDTRRPLSDVSTPLYAAKLGNEPGAVSASFEAKAFAPSADFVVAYARGNASGIELSAYVPKWGALRGKGFDAMRDDAGGGFVALRVGADLPDELATPAWTRRDRIVVLDTSQSQSQETLAGERALTLALLRRMGEGERFALLACDTACAGFPDQGLAAASEDKIAAAQAWIEKTTVHGASDVAGALLAASRRAEANGSAQLVYVGDGAATSGELSVERIAALVQSELRAKKVDLRVLGAGRTLDEVLLAGLAQALGASYEPVANGEPLPERIERIAGDLRRPVIVNPKLELPPQLTDPYPAVLPSLRLGQEVVVVAKLASAPSGSVKLSGTLDGKPYQLVRPIEWSEAPERQNPLVPRLWASARIAELEAGPADKTQKELVELSKRFHVMSRATSLLVLESSQMFAEFGIKQSEPPRVEAALPAQSAASLLNKELGQLDMATLGAVMPSAGSGLAGGPGTGGGLAGIGNTPGLGDIGAGQASKVEGPRGVASVGGAQVSGGNVANAARVVAGMRAGFRSCYQKGLAADPNLQGSVKVVAKINADGSVASANPAGMSGLSAGVAACVVARVRSAQFDPPEGGAATIVIPISFKQDTSPRPPPPPDDGMNARPWMGGHPSGLMQDRAVHRASDDKWMSAGEDALDKLKKALDAAKDSRQKNAALIRGLLSRGRFEEALGAAKRFAELDPDLPLARELVSYAAAARGDSVLALASVEALVEADPRNTRAQLRAARAFEAAGDEMRGCSHWRALFELTPKAEEVAYQALRCRARTLGDKDGALAAAKALVKPGKLIESLIPLIEAGNAPAYDKGIGGAGSFEASLTCAAGVSDCPTLLVVTPQGVVFSPWTPGGSRSSRSSVAFTGLASGTYRTLIIGGAPDARGEVTLRAFGSTSRFAFTNGGLHTVAATEVTIESNQGWGLGWIGGITSFDAVR